MDKLELSTRIKKVLPKNWVLTRITEPRNTDKWDWDFTIKCPISDRMGNPDEYRNKIDKICKAANALHDGGGWSVGGDVYDNFFYVYKTEKQEIGSKPCWLVRLWKRLWK